jgi:hypothetical protein
MTAILRRLPFSERYDEVALDLERIRVRPYQVIVWASLSVPSTLELPPHTRRFPALLDTGHNHTLALQRRHLLRWAGLDPERIPRRGRLREGSHLADCYLLNGWLHPNEPGQRDRLADRPPFCLELPEGVAVYPDEGNYPRLPLLGLRALVRNRLHFTLDPERRVVHLRTPDWRTQLLYYLA